jgi:hypothetical protein
VRALVVVVLDELPAEGDERTRLLVAESGHELRDWLLF